MQQIYFTHTDKHQKIDFGDYLSNPAEPRKEVPLEVLDNIDTEVIGVMRQRFRHIAQIIRNKRPGSSLKSTTRE